MRACSLRFVYFVGSGSFVIVAIAVNFWDGMKFFIFFVAAMMLVIISSDREGAASPAKSKAVYRYIPSIPL